MELITLLVDKEKELGVSKKQIESEQIESENIVVYDPKPSEVLDKNVKKRIKKLNRKKTKQQKKEKINAEKFRNALTFTDISATIKKAGFHKDGSPRLAIGRLFDSEVYFGRHFTEENKRVAKFESSNRGNNQFEDNFSLLLGPVRKNKKVLYKYLTGLVLAFIALVFLPIFLIIIPFLKTREVSDEFDEIDTGSGNFVRIKTPIFTKIPEVPCSVLSKVVGDGPFAILFEVTEGWRDIKSDPVILRIIDFNGQMFFEPMVGYNMTPLEKKSLTEARSF